MYLGLTSYNSIANSSSSIYKMGRINRPTVRFALRVAKHSLLTVSLRAEIRPLITFSVEGRDIPAVKSLKTYPKNSILTIQ